MYKILRVRVRLLLSSYYVTSTNLNSAFDLGNFVAFAAHSGGIFLDMGIHHVSVVF
jgi:predicted dehydrogenase